MPTTILPAMTLPEAIDTTRTRCVAGLTGDRTALVTMRPFRVPHHTISDVGLIGGRQVPMPSEVSLAYRGGLLLDERPACKRHLLRSCASPARRVSYEYNFPDIIDLTMLVALTILTKTADFDQY